MPHRRTLSVVMSFALLLAVAGALVEESFVHTDDGCAVEIHCLACRLAVGTTAVAGVVLGVLVRTLEEAGLVAPVAQGLTQSPAADHGFSRGPPLL
jgi:hypothetical protein